VPFTTVQPVTIHAVPIIFFEKYENFYKNYIQDLKTMPKKIYNLKEKVTNI